VVGQVGPIDLDGAARLLRSPSDGNRNLRLRQDTESSIHYATRRTRIMRKKRRPVPQPHPGRKRRASVGMKEGRSSARRQLVRQEVGRRVAKKKSLTLDYTPGCSF